MKIPYIEKRFSANSESIIFEAANIIREYQHAGFNLTLRQLYYQFVSRDIIPNSQREYKRLGSIINDARLAGRIDWTAIIDRTRELRSNSHWKNPSQIIAACAEQFEIDKWEDQECRVEVWIEKDALVGVIDQVCRQLDVPFFSCRGYTSQSEMWEAGQRMIKYLRADQMPVILHLGDHDPSGRDMSRDIEDRLFMFINYEMADSDFEFKRIALNMDQINKYEPPPNPAKITDSRAQKYIDEFGRESWELDALDPKAIVSLISKNVNKYLNVAKFRALLRLEKEHKQSLLEAKKWI